MRPGGAGRTRSRASAMSGPDIPPAPSPESRRPGRAPEGADPVGPLSRPAATPAATTAPLPLPLPPSAGTNPTGATSVVASSPSTRPPPEVDAVFQRPGNPVMGEPAPGREKRPPSSVSPGAAGLIGLAARGPRKGADPAGPGEGSGPVEPPPAAGVELPDPEPVPVAGRGGSLGAGGPPGRGRMTKALEATRSARAGSCVGASLGW